MRAEPTRPLTAVEIAKRAAMSPRTLVCGFTEAMGLLLGGCVTTPRIEEAKPLLEASPLPIEDVAPKAGFGGIATMRRHARSQIGLSPRDRREASHGVSAATIFDQPKKLTLASPVLTQNVCFG